MTSQRIFEMLREEQRAAGATVVMVSSDLDRMLTVTDRVGMLFRGKLIFDGTTAEAKAVTSQATIPPSGRTEPAAWAKCSAAPVKRK